MFKMKKILALIMSITIVFSIIPCTDIISFANEDDIMLGDVDFDGRMNITDARLALKIASGIEPITEKNLFAADGDRNGMVLSNDARVILRAACALEIFGSSYNDDASAITPIITMTAEPMGEIGSEISVVVSATDFLETQCADLKFYFDSSALEFVSITSDSGASLCSGGLTNDGEVSFSFVFSTYATDDAGLCTIKFKVLTKEENSIALDIKSWFGTQCPALCSVLIENQVADTSDITDFLTYEINDGEVTITDCDTSISGDVVIPDTIEGYPVTTIGERSFWNCTNLKSIYIPESISYIEVPAFISCHNLENIMVSEDNDYYSNDDYGVLFNKDKTTIVQYPLGNSRTEYTIPEGVLIIDDASFSHAWNLETVIIANSVTTIKATAFSMYDCGTYKLKNVIMGNNVTYIGESAFSYCSTLENINISTSLIDIEDYAFTYCSSLKNINLPKSLCHIGFNNFNFCSSLTDVYYAGTVTQWDNISIEGTNDDLYNATIHYVEVEEKLSFLDYLTYEINDDKVRITGCDTSISGDVVIPDTIEGYPVTAIGYCAFEKCDNITSITIPECITSIDTNAFYECNGITDVYYGGNDAAWGWFADNIGLSESCTTHFAKDSELIDYFKYSIADDEVAIIDCSTTISGDIAIPCTIEGYSVTKINHAAFSNCKKLTGLIIPDSVTVIDAHAFSHCEGLTDITIPKNVISIGEFAFYSCNSLEQISVDKDNEYYFADEYGVLFNKNKTELIQYPIGNDRAEYTIPDSVILIGFGSFYRCKNLKNITIGNNVKEIASEAFEFCSSLEKVIIPESVTIINDFAFYGCESISSITLEGFTTYIEFYAFGYETVTHSSNGSSSSWLSPIDGFIIYGIPNSASERYANEYGFTFVSIAEDNSDEPSEKKELVVSDTCGNNLTWSLYSDGEFVVEGTGNEYEFYGVTQASPWWLYRSDIVNAIIKDGVTSIHYLSFRECINLKSVFIPVSVETISDDAFWEATNLEIVYYAGTQEEWDEIVGSEYLKDIEIVFNYCYVDEPSIEETTTQEPTIEKPSEETTTQEPTTEVPPVEESTTQEPVTEKPSDEETTTQEPTTEAPSVEETTTQEPTTENPSTENPTVQEPTTDEPATAEPPVEIEKTELVVNSNSDIIADENAKTVIVTEKSDVSTVKNQIENEIQILDSNGNQLEESELVGTGCRVQLIDSNGYVLSEYTVIVECDIDGNGKITAADARLALRASAQLENLDGVYAQAANVDGNDKVTAADARKILRKSAGLE